MQPKHRFALAVPAAASVALAAGLASAASHREAPFITSSPRWTPPTSTCSAATRPGREAYVTLVANYLPLQDPYGGPNYFTLDPNALYDIHIDNDGDAVEDLTFQFRFQTTQKTTRSGRRAER